MKTRPFQTIVQQSVIILFILISPQLLAQKADTNHCDLANEYIKHYKFTQAIDALDACYNTKSKDLSYFKKLALCYKESGQLTEAKSANLKILALDSLNIPALNQLAMLHRKEKEYNKALSYYRMLLQIDSTNSYYHKQSAAISAKIGLLGNVVVHYHKAVQSNPKDLEAIKGLCLIYHDLGLNDRAKQVLDTAHRLLPQNSTLFQLDAKLAYHSKDYKGVLECVHEIAQISGDTSTYLLKLLGISQYHLSDYPRAIESLLKITARNESTELTHYLIASAYQELGDSEASISHFEKAIKLGISENIAVYYTKLASAYESEKKYAQAIQAYQAAYRNSKDETILYHLARNYDSFYKNKETALRYYQRYLSANDTANMDLVNYSTHRVSELKQAAHFDVDTLN